MLYIQLLWLSALQYRTAAVNVQQAVWKAALRRRLLPDRSAGQQMPVFFS